MYQDLERWVHTSDRVVGKQPRKTNQVDRPHVPIGKALPEHTEGQSLTIVHITFDDPLATLKTEFEITQVPTLTGVITKDTVDHDLLFVLGKPTILASQFRGSLGW